MCFCKLALEAVEQEYDIIPIRECDVCKADYWQAGVKRRRDVTGQDMTLVRGRMTLRVTV